MERVTFDFSKDALSRLDKMRRAGENRAEVIRRGLRILEWMQEFPDQANVIVREPDEDDFETTIGALTR